MPILPAAHWSQLRSANPRTRTANGIQNWTSPRIAVQDFFCDPTIGTPPLAIFAPSVGFEGSWSYKVILKLALEIRVTESAHAGDSKKLILSLGTRPLKPF